MEETLRLILEKLNSMDSDIKSLKTDVSGLKTDVSGLKTDVSGLKQQVFIIENEHGAKLDSLIDGYKQLYEGQQEIRNDIKEMKETINVHEVKLLKVK